MDFLDRGTARPRGRPARYRGRYVHTYAVPEQRFRARLEPQRANPVEVRAEAGSDRHPGDVLRHGQSRGRVWRRQDLPLPGRHDLGGARREDRQCRVERQERRSEEGRDGDQRPDGGQGQGDRRHQRRRVRCPSSCHRLQPQGRIEGMAGLFGRTRRPDPVRRQHHRARQARRQGFVLEDLAGRPVEDRWRRHLGLVLLRPATELVLLRFGQSRAPGTQCSGRATTNGR